MRAQSLSHVRLCIPVDHSPPGSSVHGYGLPFLPPGDFPDPWIEPTSPALQADSLPLGHQGSPKEANKK